jgi:hypothetical protein
MDKWCCAKESSGSGHFLNFLPKYFYEIEGTIEGSLSAMIKLCARWLEQWDHLLASVCPGIQSKYRDD